MENNHISKKYKVIQDELRKADLKKIECLKCGNKDNNYKPRQGLCMDCFCKFLNSCMDDGMKLEEALAHIKKESKRWAKKK